MSGVAYVVTSYRLPGQVRRLVARLRAGSPDAPILVHHDRRGGVLALPGARELDRPIPVEWGTGSQLRMVLRCLRAALEHDWRWLVLLSGQDYPLRPLPAIEADLLAADCDAFVEHRPVPPPRGREPDEFAKRYFYAWRRVPRALSPPAAARPLLLARDLPSGRYAGRRRLRTPFGPDLPCRRGGDWFTLSRRAVEVVDAFARNRPAVLRHYDRTLVPTESFVATVLAATPGLRLSGDTRRFTAWTPGAARPGVLRLADVERARASGADFARKLDEGVDPAALDALDR